MVLHPAVHVHATGFASVSRDSEADTLYYVAFACRSHQWFVNDTGWLCLHTLSPGRCMHPAAIAHQYHQTLFKQVTCRLSALFIAIMSGGRYAQAAFVVCLGSLHAQKLP